MTELRTIEERGPRMKTYPTRSDDGRLYAFEVENAYIGSRKVAKILEGLRDVSAVRVRRRSGSPSERERCDREVP